MIRIKFKVKHKKTENYPRNKQAKHTKPVDMSKLNAIVWLLAKFVVNQQNVGNIQQKYRCTRHVGNRNTKYTSLWAVQI